ncbi:MAG: ABC transporter permease [Spirochaetia bacterium]|nr:ABC transporter permease [Spirochaetia bacterium]MBQ3648408.1 ABC transporter permease [Spirochaetia bacterium]MBQ3713365.1 ABC transporter permease [Spirochaetia bacterium]MBQ6674448.1 ABC transporter permease [Spirochaetia bacterium]MBR0318867.1 ABC transporter permease [Spirochaetia bacterium]
MHVKYFLVKTLRAFITTFLLVVFVFFVLRITGDPAQAMLPDDATEEDYIEFRQIWGLDKPLMEQFWVYCKNFIHGDFGQSYKDGRDVFEVISQRLPKSVWLMGMSIIFSIVVGLPLGIYAALHRNSFGDRFVMGAAVFGFSMPNFFLGIMFILIFSMKLHWLPSAGSDTWLHLLLPMITIGMTRMGSYARYTRSAMLNVLSKPYIITAKAKGANRNRMVYLHALPNAAIPIVTVIGTSIGHMVGGSVVIENVFAWPGVGRLLVSSVAVRDLPVVQAIVIVMGLAMVLANLLVDFTYGLLDPRIRITAGDK